MATLAFGIAGAGIGSAVGGPMGAKWGWSIGTVLGGMIDAPRFDIGKLYDRRITSSAYGSVIPKFWGGARLGGTVVWTATDSSGNTLITHNHPPSLVGITSGGANNITYTATCCVAFAVGTIYLRDAANPTVGSLSCRNVVLERLWGDDLILYEKGTTGLKLTLGTNLFFYPGTETDAQDPIIEAAMGSQTSAYCGIAKIVVENLDLSLFGERLPNFSAEFSTDDCTLADVLGDLCGEAGITSEYLNLTAAAAIPIRASTANPPILNGVVVADGMPPQDTIQLLLQAFQGDFPEIDGKLTYVQRGGSVVTTIAYDDLGASSEKGEQALIRIQREQTSVNELPVRVEVSYLDVQAHYQQAVEGDQRSTPWPLNINRVQMPICMDYLTARTMAGQILDTMWTESGSFKISVPPQYMYLSGADPVTLETENGNVRVRLTDIGLAPLGEMRLTCLPDNPDILNQVVGPVSGTKLGASSPPPAVNDTAFVAWSGKELSDADEASAGFYVAAAGTGPNWSGGTIYYSTDGGTTYVQEPQSATQAANFGVTNAALANGVTADAWDTTDSLNVDLSESNGSIASASNAQVEAGQNIVVIGSEILGVSTSALQSDGTYTVSDLLRGLRGSTMTGHTTGEMFVVADSSIVRISVPAALIGSTILVKVLSYGNVLSDVTAQSVTIATPTVSSTQSQINTLQSQATQMIAPTYFADPASIGTLTMDNAWHTVTPSGVPSGATHVILQGYVSNDGDPDNADQEVNVRSSSSMTGFYRLTKSRGVNGSYTDEQGIAPTMIPLSAGGTFDYLVSATIMTVVLEIAGYWAPVS